MLSKIPSWLWAVLVCVVIYGAGVWRGLDVVTEEYEAKIAVMNAVRAEEERARAEAVAAAERQAHEALVAATARGEKLARELATKTAELDAERASVNRRIRDVSEKARRDCAGLSLESSKPPTRRITFHSIPDGCGIASKPPTRRITHPSSRDASSGF